MNSTCKDFLHVHIENRREVKRKAKHYNLDVIISVGKIQKLHNCITAQLHNCITARLHDCKTARQFEIKV